MSAINVCKIFKKNCGPGAVFLASEFRQRGEHNTLAICFEMVPEGRKFDLDTVLHEGETDEEQVTNAVLKIAGIAKNIRQVLEQPDGAGSLKIERQLS